MIDLKLPFVKLPEEYLQLLKTNFAGAQSLTPIVDILRQNKALSQITETSMKEFDDGRGFAKVVNALGWPNFRERLASLFLFKMIHGSFPPKSDMELVDDLHETELRFQDHTTHGNSRIFLLAFYCKMANIQEESRSEGSAATITLGADLATVMKLSQVKSDKPDWLMLLIMHLSAGLGQSVLVNSLLAGKQLQSLYEMLTPSDRELMNRNLLSYGASINEPDFFLYEKV